MISRFRLRAPIYTSALLLLCGISLAAKATTPVTRSQMESFVYVVVAGAGVCVFGSFWVLLTYINGRVELHVARLEKSVEDLGKLLADHHVDPLAHPAGSAARINPLTERLDGFAEKIGKTHDIVVQLKAEHELIREQESEFCRFIRATGSRTRRDDPHGIDPTPLRSGA